MSALEVVLLAASVTGLQALVVKYYFAQKAKYMRALMRDLHNGEAIS